MAIDLTEAARQRVIALNSKEQAPDRWLKLGIRGGGCSGFMYSMDFVDEPGERDKRFEFDDVKVCVDHVSSRRRTPRAHTTQRRTPNSPCERRASGSTDVRTQHEPR